LSEAGSRKGKIGGASLSLTISDSRNRQITRVQKRCTLDSVDLKGLDYVILMLVLSAFWSSQKTFILVVNGGKSSGKPLRAFAATVPT